MRTAYIFALATTLQFGTNLLGGTGPLDNQYFIHMRETLESQSQMATGIEEKRTNADAFCALAMKALNADGLSNTVRFAVATSAVKAYRDFLWAIPQTPAALGAFSISSSSSNVLSLLVESTKTLARIPTPHDVVGNVTPPVWTPGPGPVVSGMDPEGIKDPKARAEYERRIDENSRAAQELHSRANLERAMNSLAATIEFVVATLDAEGKASPLKAAIKNSQLPPEIKARILGDGDKR